MTDIHANLPALQAALGDIRAQGCSAIYHTGDAIAIGPHPLECLELLRHIPNVHLVRGNHESYFVDGLPEPRPPWMSEGEVAHQYWLHALLGPQWRAELARWPYCIEAEFAGVKTCFVHYGLAPSGRDFQPIVRHSTAAVLDQVFDGCDAALIFFGHDHREIDLCGRARYVNPGSLGCCATALARYCLVEFSQGHYTLEQRQVPYDDAGLFRDFEQRQVPERQFIYRVFLGGRFP